MAARHRCLPGLSPRVRGNPGEYCRITLAIGSIPACAGEPAHAGSGCRPSRVYPRVCGGTGDLRRVFMGNQGLSPRVRGNRIATGKVLAE